MGAIDGKLNNWPLVIATPADRIGIKTLADGKRVRFFKSSGEMLDA